MRKQQRGIALFQVLLITAIITVLAIQFTQTAKNQVAIAQLLVDRAKAEVAIKSAESELVFKLLTENKDQATSFPNLESWNFHNQDFAYSDNVTVRMQDQYSLLSLYYIKDGSNVVRLANLLDLPVSQSFGDVIIDWQDENSLSLPNGAESSRYSTPGFPTNIAFQQTSEIAYLSGGNQNVSERLSPFVSLRPHSFFNPLSAPKEILLLFMSQQKVDQVLKLRENGNLTARNFSAITGLRQDELQFFSTSGLLRMEFEASIGEVSLTKSMEIDTKPYDKLPYIEYEIRY
ncbi:general secretion pathway protein GspK [Thalassotalea montiporae]